MQGPVIQFKDGKMNSTVDMTDIVSAPMMQVACRGRPSQVSDV